MSNSAYNYMLDLEALQLDPRGYPIDEPPYLTPPIGFADDRGGAAAAPSSGGPALLPPPGDGWPAARIVGPAK